MNIRFGGFTQDYLKNELIPKAEGLAKTPFEKTVAEALGILAGNNSMDQTLSDIFSKHTLSS